MHNRKSLSGFTMVELMVTLAIASILVGIATPSFQTMISNSRLTAAANDLLSALSYARSEAVKRGIPVTIIRIEGSTASEWQPGWSIFADADGDNTTNPDVAKQCLPNQDCMLQIHDALHPGYTLTTGGNYTDRVTFFPNGRTDPSLLSDTFTLCDDSHDDAQSREIIVSNTGRARVSVGTGDCSP